MNNPDHLKGVCAIANALGRPEDWRSVGLHLKNGKIPHWKIGASYRASLKTLQDWMKAQEQLTLEGRELTPQAITLRMETIRRKREGA